MTTHRATPGPPVILGALEAPRTLRALTWPRRHTRLAELPHKVELMPLGVPRVTECRGRLITRLLSAPHRDTPAI